MLKRRRPAGALILVPTADHGFDPLSDVCLFCGQTRANLDAGGLCERIAYQANPRLTARC